MAFRYKVRVVNADGEVVIKKRFKHKDKAVNFIGDKLKGERKVSVKREKKPDKFKITPNTEYRMSSHSAWETVSGPLSQVFVHTSVTKQLSKNATVAEEKAEMTNLDSIAHARGYNGISYSFCIFPSGRIYEGRGWLVVEAATLDYNSVSDSIVFVGNTDAFKPTDEQMRSLNDVIEHGQSKGKLVRTGLNVRGHREVAAKACPGRYVTDKMIADVQKAVNG